MNSTERLLACLNGELPDRIPVSTYELVGWNPDSWENRQKSYSDLMQLIREKTDCMYMCDVPVPNALQEHLSTHQTRWEQDGKLFTSDVIDAGSRQLKQVEAVSENINTIWKTEHYVKDIDDLHAWLKIPWGPGEPDFSQLQNTWQNLGRTRGLPLITVGDPICELAEAMEFGNLMMHAVTNPSEIKYALDVLHDRSLARLKKILSGPVRNAIIRIVGPEYACPPYMNPEMFREFVTGYDKIYCEMIRAAGAFARIHAHGKISKVLDQIVEMQPHALDPIEPIPDGDIDLPDVKRLTNNSICLMGGIELKHLECADEAFVKRLVQDLIKQAKEGGSFVIMPTAAPINIPLSQQTERNYYCYINTALELGGY